MPYHNPSHFLRGDFDLMPKQYDDKYDPEEMEVIVKLLETAIYEGDHSDDEDFDREEQMRLFVAYVTGTPRAGAASGSAGVSPDLPRPPTSAEEPTDRSTETTLVPEQAAPAPLQPEVKPNDDRDSAGPGVETPLGPPTSMEELSELFSKLSLECNTLERSFSSSSTLSIIDGDASHGALSPPPANNVQQDERGFMDAVWSRVMERRARERWDDTNDDDREGTIWGCEVHEEWDVPEGGYEGEEDEEANRRMDEIVFTVVVVPYRVA